MMEENGLEITYMKKIKRVLVLCITALLLMACSKKEDPILPFSAIMPGMTLKEIKKLEPGIKNITCIGGEKSCVVDKEYNGIQLFAYFKPESLNEDIVWAVAMDNIDNEKLEAFYDDIKAYCNERYKFEWEETHGGNHTFCWRKNDDGIFLSYSSVGTEIYIVKDEMAQSETR